jgi:hypothetical protein
VPTRGQNRQEGEFDEISEIVHREASAHTSRLIDHEPLTLPVGLRFYVSRDECRTIVAFPPKGDSATIGAAPAE